MGTMLCRIDEEEIAYQREDMTNRARALVAMGLVSREGNGFDVCNLGFCRGSVTVSGDLLYCTCGKAMCEHREAARLFVEQPEKKPIPARREADPVGPNVAKTMSELISPKQLVAIRVMANARGLSAEEESRRLMNCPPERLTRKAASRLIQALEGM